MNYLNQVPAAPQGVEAPPRLLGSSQRGACLGGGASPKPSAPCQGRAGGTPLIPTRPRPLPSQPCPFPAAPSCGREQGAATPRSPAPRRASSRLPERNRASSVPLSRRVLCPTPPCRPPASSRGQKPHGFASRCPARCRRSSKRRRPLLGCSEPKAGRSAGPCLLQPETRRSRGLRARFVTDRRPGSVFINTA